MAAPSFALLSPTQLFPSEGRSNSSCNPDLLRAVISLYHYALPQVNIIALKSCNRCNPPLNRFSGGQEDIKEMGLH